jgi:hypothetical protein
VKATTLEELFEKIHAWDERRGPEPTAEEWAIWPTCAMPDCGNKATLWDASGLCYPCAFGGTAPGGFGPLAVKP